MPFMENQPEYYFKKYQEECTKNGRLLQFVELIAVGKRPDGTYNYCREVLEKIAKELLNASTNN